MTDPTPPQTDIDTDTSDLAETALMRIGDYYYGDFYPLTSYSLESFLNGEIGFMIDALTTHYQAEALQQADAALRLLRQLLKNLMQRENTGQGWLVNSG